MAQPPADRSRAGSRRRGGAPHHISAIAHLFLDDDGHGAGPRRFAVAGLDAGRASACACAALVAAARESGQGRAR